jgi:hypothetical protein
MAPKKPAILSNVTIVAALITLCGTLLAALLGSPVLANLINGTGGSNQPAATPIPSTTSQVTATTPPLPDLVTLDISAPTCVTDRRAGSHIRYVRHQVTIRNLGPGSTVPFGTFSSRVVVIMEGQRYTLDQWNNITGGPLEIPNLGITGLGPNQDISFSISLDPQNKTSYGLEVVTNSGSNVIPEVNTTNNTRLQEFSSNCR